MKKLIKSIKNNYFITGLKYFYDKATEAYKAKRYLESAIIYFQLIEFQLRFTILILAQ